MDISKQQNKTSHRKSATLIMMHFICAIWAGLKKEIQGIFINLISYIKANKIKAGKIYSNMLPEPSCKTILAASGLPHQN